MVVVEENLGKWYELEFELKKGKVKDEGVMSVVGMGKLKGFRG